MKLIIILLLFIPQISHALIGADKLVGFSDLVRLDFKDGNMCTGVFLNPETILTAAHCLKNDALDKVITENDQVIPVQEIKRVSHPSFNSGFWPRHDVGIIKTTKNVAFQNQFSLADPKMEVSGESVLYGCGISSFDPKERVRSSGKSSFWKMGSVLIFQGKPSIAPNDSGGPIVDVKSGKVIALSSKTTVTSSWKPTLGFATYLLEESNYQFIQRNLDP